MRTKLVLLAALGASLYVHIGYYRRTRKRLGNLARAIEAVERAKDDRSVGTGAYLNLCRAEMGAGRVLVHRFHRIVRP